MAHGQNAKKYSKRGHDWWGRRPLSGVSLRVRGMKMWKKVLHGIERARAKKLLKEEE